MSNRYKVVFEKKYIKDFKHIHPSYHKAIHDAAVSLGENPRPEGYTKLKGTDNLYRIRCGDYRIIYTIQDDVLIVLVIEVGHKKDIYKSL